ncbi:MAG: DUF805 domain-containing protein [Qipengyuania sp.]
MEWMILPFKRYAEFSGRSRRMEYWMFALLNVIVMTVLMFLAFGAGGFANLADPEAAEAGLGAMFGGLGLLLVIYALAVLIPSVAVTVRRLHDRDMSGWWYLGAILGSMIPVIGFLVSIAFLVLMALPGTRGPNRYGPDPKAAEALATTV